LKHDDAGTEACPFANRSHDGVVHEGWAFRTAARAEMPQRRHQVNYPE
jgi:hypothetical protein